LKISFILVGTLKKPYIKDGVGEYLKRIKRYCPVELIEIKEEHGTRKGHGPGTEGLKKEARRILSKLDRADYKCVLVEKREKGEKGEGAGSKTFDSKAFARFIEVLLSGGKKRLCFIVGGPFGMHPELIDRADTLLSLSTMTFPHEMAALVLTEQVYRAFTILRGEPYSH
jgi:23S rRNA (pseudouridine1915-N3)-methyltransferase